MQESDETSCEFFIASKSVSLPLNFVDETFDEIAFSIADLVIVPWLPVIAAGSGDRPYLWDGGRPGSCIPSITEGVTDAQGITHYSFRFIRNRLQSYST